jgi:two-component sensor histidine kinase
MTPDTGALVWVGTRNGGLYLIHKQKGILQTFDTTAAGQRLPANNIRAITRIDDSLLCIGFEEKGIRFLNTHTRRLLPGDPVPGAFTLKCIYYHAPYCWIGTLGKGLCIYDMRNGHIAWINEQHGLPNNTIYGILEDRQHRLWFSTNKGLDLYYPPSDPAATSRSNFYGFGREAGLQSNEFNTGAWHQAADGRLFFGGIAGLTYFHPDKIELGGFQPSVTITGIMANNTPLAIDTATPYKKYYELDYTQNNLSFNYAALEFVSNDKIDYSYILRPFDKDTIDVGNRNYVTYTNLPPGHYVFEVVENSPFSEEKLNAAHIDIYIRPPFWKTSWFIVACVLAVIGLLTVLYRYRIRQLLKVQQIRNHIATDLHDDIGSTLTNISLLAELSRKSREKGSDAGPFLDRISEEVQNSSQALDDIVWSINTNNDSIGQILARMRRYASEIFDGANTRYEFQADINSSRKKIPMDQRRDFFLVFKESINNIYKHADASQIHIHVSMRAGLLTLRIEDNGKGFDTQAVTHRNGLKNIRFRVEKWKGRVDIHAVQGGGTTIFIEFPLR